MKKVILKVMCTALCLTMLTACGKDRDKGSQDKKTDRDAEIVSEIADDKATGKADSDEGEAEENTEETSSDSDEAFGETDLSPIAYNNSIVDAGAGVEILSEANSINVVRKALNYKNVFGVGVDEDSIVPIDTQIQLSAVYFAAQGDGTESITVMGNFSIPSIESKTDLFLNLYIVDLATDNIINTTEECTYKVGNQEITGKGTRSYSTVSAESVEFETSNLIPSGYRDLGILICDAEVLPLSEAQHNCKDVIEYSNVSEIPDGNKTLYIFDLSQFGESNGYLYWPSDLMQ